MSEKLYTINEIITWYNINVEQSLTQDFIINLFTLGLLTENDKGKYSLDEINDLLLEKHDGSFVLKNSKFTIKENRLKQINKFKKSKNTKNKFKIANMGGNKLKLIKLED